MSSFFLIIFIVLNYLTTLLFRRGSFFRLLQDFLSSQFSFVVFQNYKLAQYFLISIVVKLILNLQKHLWIHHNYFVLSLIITYKYMYYIHQCQAFFHKTSIKLLKLYHIKDSLFLTFLYLLM